MQVSRQIREQVAKEAIDWFLALQANDCEQPDPPEFSEWLLRSPLHVEEYLAVSKAWGSVGASRQAQLLPELIEAARSDHPPANVVSFLRQPGMSGAPHLARSPLASERQRSVLALAAAVLLSLCLWAVNRSTSGGAEFGTAIGQQRTVTLPDGSIVFMNTDSRVRVNFTGSQREIYLQRGEARFQVKKNASRSFIVTTPKATVRALGTIFNVRTDPLQTQVAVIEGWVEVKAQQGHEAVAQKSPPGPLLSRAEENRANLRPVIQLAAGERAEVTSGGIRPDAGPTVEAVEAWTERRLVFRQQRLADVVREFNRYRDPPLVVSDPALAELEISGAFDLADPESLLSYLQSFEGVRVEASADGTQRLSVRPLP